MARATKPKAKKAEAPTTERLRELLNYDPETGHFIRRQSSGPAKAGDVSGWMRQDGYIEISLCGRVYKAHRVAWLCVYGRWPAQVLDHINGDRSDNRIANLRECNSAENCQNKRIYRNNTSGHTGVCWHHPNRAWVARISRDGRKRCLGYFKDKAEAVAAYLAAKAQLHTFQPIPRGN